MNYRVVQLLSSGPDPAWWLALQNLPGLDCRFATSAELLPTSQVIMIPRRALTEIRREDLSSSKAYIIVDEGWTAVNLKRALALLKGALFADTLQATHNLAQVVQIALARQLEREQHSELMQMMRVQNRQIDELNQSLEQVVHDRTLNEAESRKAAQGNIARMREIIGFIKELGQVFDIADLLPLVRRQVKEFHALESPILFVPRGPEVGDLYYLRSSQTIRTKARGRWVVSARIRVNEPEDSQFLANIIGRPVGKVIRFPLLTVRHQKDPSRSPLLLFELNSKGLPLEPMLDSLSEKLQPVSWALDRLVLEQELKSTSRDWEMTFDGLTEPIAILDHDGKVLRCNSHWSDSFQDVMRISTSQIRHRDRLYVVEKYPIRMNAEAPPISWVVYLRDETRSRQLKSQVVQVEKMSAVGQLAGHIAHELNNPLTGIRSLAQVLLTEVPNQQQAHADLQEVEKASARCQGIINNLLDYSKGHLEQSLEVTDLNDIAMRTLPLLKSATGRFRSNVQLTDTSLPVRVEPHLMQQVIFNLINNACQAMQDKGEISVHTRVNPPWAEIEVSDTGPGIAADLQERIFEPFFTTKPEGEGTGLGLSLSRDFVRQFGGELDCESKVGEGTTFRVRLPLEKRS